MSGERCYLLPPWASALLGLQGRLGGEGRRLVSHGYACGVALVKAVDVGVVAVVAAADDDGS